CRGSCNPRRAWQPGDCGAAADFIVDLGRCRHTPVQQLPPHRTPRAASQHGTPGTMRPLPTLLTLALAAAFGGFTASAINAHLDNRAEAATGALLPATAALPASVAGQPVPSLAPMLERVMPAVVSVN